VDRLNDASKPSLEVKPTTLAMFFLQWLWTFAYDPDRWVWPWA